MTGADLNRLGQSLEAEPLLKAINIHLDDEISVQLGRTELENPDEIDAQLGAPAELSRLIPDQPVDGFDAVAAGETDETATAND